MNRVIKFRAWDGNIKKMYLPDAISCDGDVLLISGGGDHCSLMQFTGLKDKNGKEIYEGDILKGVFIYCGEQDGTLPTTGSVEYCAEYTAFGVMVDGRVSVSHNHLFPLFEVIGNIYENPELIQTNGKREH